jgi:hypothetical protein
MLVLSFLIVWRGSVPASGRVLARKKDEGGTHRSPMGDDSDISGRRDGIADASAEPA